MMKIQILSGMLVGLTATAHAQGQIQLSNFDNSSTNPAATANGLFWLSTGGTLALINQDFNAAFYGGTESNSLSPLATFLLSNGTATGDNAGGPGKFVDPTGNIYTFLNTSLANPSVFFQIQAWTGNFNSYVSALAGGASAAQSTIFTNPLGLPPGAPAELTGMPAIVLGVPEPSTLMLVGLGGLCFLLLSRRRK